VIRQLGAISGSDHWSRILALWTEKLMIFEAFDSCDMNLLSSFASFRHEH